MKRTITVTVYADGRQVHELAPSELDKIGKMLSANMSDYYAINAEEYFNITENAENADKTAGK